MRAVHASTRLVRHTVAGVVEALLVLGIIATLVFGYSAIFSGQAPGGASDVLAGKGGAGKPGGGGGGKPGGGGGGSGSLRIVMVEDLNGNGSPNWGDTITYAVTSSASNPFVDTLCYQNGQMVYSAGAGWYDSYPWPGARNMPLYSPSWTGGGADCRAVINTGGSLNFSVGA